MTRTQPAVSADDGDPSAENRDVLQSYDVLRLTVGFVAIALPLGVVCVVAAVEGDLLASISESYHHTFAASLFVGSLFAFAAFFWAYQFKEATLGWPRVLGGRLTENGWGNLAAVFALGVAVFSNAPEKATGVDPSPPAADVVAPPPPASARPAPGGSAGTFYDHLNAEVIGTIHLASAIALFATLLIFCVLWAKGAGAGSPKRSYQVSAVVIAAGVVCAITAWLWGHLGLGGIDSRLLSTVFLAAEIAMVEAFGYSWLVRGTVRPGVALGMVAAVSVPTAGLLVWFTMVTSANPGRPLETAMSEVSALAGLVGLVVALGLLTMLHLRRGGTGLRLRERAGS